VKAKRKITENVWEHSAKSSTLFYTGEIT
jgi:hypothetical protein